MAGSTAYKRLVCRPPGPHIDRQVDLDVPCYDLGALSSGSVPDHPPPAFCRDRTRVLKVSHEHRSGRPSDPVTRG